MCIVMKCAMVYIANWIGLYIYACCCLASYIGWLKKKLFIGYIPFEKWKVQTTYLLDCNNVPTCW